MTAEEIAKCIISIQIAQHVANHFNCLTDEDNANIDKVATLLASQIAVDKANTQGDLK